MVGVLLAACRAVLHVLSCSAKLGVPPVADLKTSGGVGLPNHNFWDPRFCVLTHAAPDPKLLSEQKANNRTYMFALGINSSRHRNLRGGLSHDTLAEDLPGRREPGGSGYRSRRRRRKAARLLSGSLPASMSASTIVLHQVAVKMVEERQNKGRIWPISTRKSGHMISSLPSISLAIWLTIAVSLAFLSVVLVSARSSVRYPYFSTLIHFTTFSCYALLAVGWWASRISYFWSYYAFRVIANLLTALVAWEVYRKVFGPAIALPPATPRRIALNLLVMLSSWTLLAPLLRPTVSGPYTRMALTGEQMMYGALAGTFGVLILFSRKMGITWRPRIAAIVCGLAVILIVNLAMAFLKSHLHGGTMRTANDVGQIAYLLSYLYWAWCFLEKEQPVPSSAPPELISALAKELETLKSATQVTIQVWGGRAE